MERYCRVEHESKGKQLKEMQEIEHRGGDSSGQLTQNKENGGRERLKLRWKDTVKRDLRAREGDRRGKMHKIKQCGRDSSKQPTHCRENGGASATPTNRNGRGLVQTPPKSADPSGSHLPSLSSNSPNDSRY